MSTTPKPSEAKVEKKSPHIPVRNPAFREHEGLRQLQRELNQPRKNKQVSEKGR